MIRVVHQGPLLSTHNVNYRREAWHLVSVWKTGVSDSNFTSKLWRRLGPTIRILVNSDLGLVCFEVLEKVGELRQGQSVPITEHNAKHILSVSSS